MNKVIENFRDHPSLKHDSAKLVFKIDAKLYSIIDGIVRQIIPVSIRSTNIGEPYRDLLRLKFVFVDGKDNKHEEHIDLLNNEENNLLVSELLRK